MDQHDVFTDEEIRALSFKAVNELIADAQAGRVKQNKQLAEVIAGCIRNTTPEQLQTLNRLLKQRALEMP